MCNNRKYSPEEKARLDLLTKYAVRIPSGEKLESLAQSENLTVEELKDMFEEIKAVNPQVYHDIQEKIA